MISVRELTKAYQPEGRAVDGVSFEVGRGEIVAVLGPSGCGKTTVLRCIAGFERPTSGEIALEGRVVSRGGKGAQEPVESRGLGFVHQSYALWPHKTVYQNLAYPLELRGNRPKEIQERVQKTLELVNLGAYARRYPAELSGGEQQRVALGRSLVYNPSAILLDEPLSNLDAKLREQTRFELRRLFKSLGMTALYVTHDQGEALAISDRCIVMEKGRIRQMGSPVELFTRPAQAFVADFMGSSNIVRGIAAEGGQACVELPFGSVECCGPRGTCTSTRVVVCIRPKDVVLHREAPPDGNAFRAKVAAKTFAGDFYKFLLLPVEAPGVEVTAHVYDYEKASRIAEGEEVHVHFPPGACTVLDGAE